MRHTRRNFILFSIDILLFGTAFNMIGTNTVVPDFVSRLTSSQAIIGLSGSLFNVAFLLPQLFLAQIVNRGTRRKPYMSRAVIPSRLSMAALALFIGLSGPTSFTPILIVFLLTYSFFGMTDGFVSLAWADILGSAIPNRLRGIMFGVGQFGVAIGVLLAQQVVRILLGPTGPAFPQNYAQLFGFASILFLTAAVALTLVIEEPRETPLEPGPPMGQYLGFLGNVLRTDKDFQNFIAARLFFDLASMAMPFFIVFGGETLSLPRDALVSDSILLGTVGTALASVLNGWFSRRSGSRAVIRVQGIGILIAPILGVLSFKLGQPALYGSFLLVGFINASVAVGYFDWLITHAPPASRPIYVGLTNTISAASHLSPFLGGLILSLTSNSFLVLFVFSAMMAVIGLFLSLRLSEPRQQAQSTLASVAQPGDKSI